MPQRQIASLGACAFNTSQTLDTAVPALQLEQQCHPWHAGGSPSSAASWLTISPAQHQAAVSSAMIAVHSNVSAPSLNQIASTVAVHTSSTGGCARVVSATRCAMAAAGRPHQGLLLSLMPDQRLRSAAGKLQVEL